MGKREFYAWVGQRAREIREQRTDDPDSWRGSENDPWWQEARAKREKLRG